MPWSTKDKRENRADGSSFIAWILLIGGSLGLAIVTLGAMGVLTIEIENPYLFYGVLSAVFLLFILTGSMSIKTARFFARKVESENSLRNTLLDWCRENLRSEEIDSAVGTDQVSEEALHLSRTAYIRDKLNHQFVNLDQDSLKEFIDDHVYGMIFGGEEA